MTSSSRTLRPAERAALLRQAGEHAKAGKGISNRFIERFCARVCSSDFRGVFSADYIPRGLAGLGRFIIIVNLGRRRGVRTALPPGHFVTLVATPAKLLYLDSYALPCHQQDVLRFLHACRRPVSALERQLQPFDTVFCGFYAIMFAMYHDQRRAFPLGFGRRRLEGNDAKAVQNIKTMLTHPKKPRSTRQMKR